MSSANMHNNNNQRDELSTLKYYGLILEALNSMYLHRDFSARITHILRTIGAFLDVNRVYVFEDDHIRKVTNNTYEWCSEGVEPQIDELKGIPLETIASWHEMLETEGIIRANELKSLPPKIVELMEPQSIVSVIVLPLYYDDNIFGFIGFDECRSVRNWTDEDVEVLRALANIVASMITRHNNERRIDKSSNLFSTVLDNIETPIYVTDPATNRILFANRKFTEEMRQSDVEGKLCYDIVQRNGGEMCADCPIGVLTELGNGAVYNWEVFNSVIGKWYYCTDSLIEWVDGRIVHLQTAFDITGRKNYEEQLRYNAAHDVMTGISNRTSGIALLKEMVDNGRRENFPLTFCFIDIDNLKFVNDTYGHVEGDRLITTFVDVIKGCIRESDIFARIGGDEFIIALQNCTLSNAKKIIEKVRKEVGIINSLGMLPYQVAFSEGMEEVLPTDDRSIDAIIVTADRKMYNQKQTKPKKVVATN